LEAGGAAPGIDLSGPVGRSARGRDRRVAPPPARPKTADEGRKQVKALFDALLPKAGQETLAMLAAMLTDFAEAPSSQR